MKAEDLPARLGQARFSILKNDESYFTIFTWLAPAKRSPGKHFFREERTKRAED
ncbi:hypothetical protein NC99_32230 [Sunxiuqinia dokdonensis]|uniref:Uncharacterized protein n=1 Tax=Sunxiuqinia dokdonensis TaxID=1409788 RepID=A0A0L8V6T9_9BACT|nr:hypothetical protein NC99_32230 [Sunxiuqinia dokdonensis]